MGNLPITTTAAIRAVWLAIVGNSNPSSHLLISDEKIHQGTIVEDGKATDVGKEGGKLVSVAKELLAKNFGSIPDVEEFRSKLSKLRDDGPVVLLLSNPEIGPAMASPELEHRLVLHFTRTAGLIRVLVRWYTDPFAKGEAEALAHLLQETANELCSAEAKKETSDTKEPAQIRGLNKEEDLPAEDGCRQSELTATDAEMELQRLWAGILEVGPESIDAQDSFLSIGGDSVAAMRLVGRAREQGLLLKVTEVFQYPRLKDLAQKISTGTSIMEPIEPFSLLRVKQPVQTIREQAASYCHLTTDQIQDVFPCTPLQEGLLAMTAKQAGEYVTRNVFKLRDNIDAERLKEAWNTVVATNDILRTRIVDLPDQGLVQVVVRPAPLCTIRQNLDDYIQIDKSLEIKMGEPLNQTAIIDNGQNGACYLVWTIHHALYDGWSIPFFLEQLEGVYYENADLLPIPFQGFIQYITNIDSQPVAQYWQTQLADCQAIPFPTLPSSFRQPQASQISQHTISGLCWPQTDITPSILLRAAWAIVVSRQTNSNDVAFGVVSNGRQAPVPGIERMAGPTIATVPIRVNLQPDVLVTNLLSDMQLQAVQMVPNEQFGLSNIRKLGPGAELACQFQSLLVVQPKGEDVTGSLAGEHSIFASQEQLNEAAGLGDNLGQFDTYALTVVCHLKNDGVDIKTKFDPKCVAPHIASRLNQQFDQTLRQLCQTNLSNLPVDEIQTTSEQDLRQIWAWNATVPETAETCVHDLFAARVREQPNAPAVCAWDGELTYGELDALSTQLAYRLTGLGAGPGTIVPLCFEKSMWTSVALFAVMKTGAASVLMDTTQPAARLRTFVEQTLSNSQRRLILSSVANRTLAGELVGRMGENIPVIVAAENVAKTYEQGGNPPLLARATPKDLLCVVFTSGSTGIPKGITLTHANFNSAFKHHPGFISTSSRVFDFVSYAFDVSWYSVLGTYIFGGTLCVPNQEERTTNPSAAIHRFGANCLFITPTGFRLLNHSLTSSLETIILGGEMALASDGEMWKKARIFYAYGPAECTVTSTIQRLDTNRNGINIGRGCGTTTWVVQPDGKGLVSIGEIGELWIEGPLVGNGYLGAPEKTAAAFIDDPIWLLQGGPDSPGRHGRLYRTGDLVRYEADGALQFISRKDDQVKIRGQRVELGEIEYHLKQYFAAYSSVDTAVEIVQPAQSEIKVLVVFLALGTAAKDGTLSVQITADINTKLGDVLPAHMIPSLYIPVDNIPKMVSGKTDRRRLREIYATMTLEQLTALDPARSRNSHRTAPETKTELKLQQLWAGVLGINPTSIAAEDSFLRIGGDSITAMRLVGRALDQGLQFTVTDVFQCPRLKDLAQKISTGAVMSEPVEPFSLLRDSQHQPVQVIREQAAKYCHLTVDQIQDVFPCTPLQEGLLAMTAKQAGEYVARNVLELRDNNIDIERLSKAWNQVATANDILRTRIVDLPNQGLVQVVINTTTEALTIVRQNLEDYMRDDKAQGMGLGEPLNRIVVLTDDKDGVCYLGWTIHHALYDGWSMPLLLEHLENAYSENSSPILTTPFQSFVKYITTIDPQSTVKYWQAQLAECEAAQFPTLPSPLYQPQASQLFRHTTAFQWPQTDTTPSTFLRAAWAIVVSCQTASDDVIFGTVSNGRQAPVVGIEHITGPTIATIPIRVKIKSNTSVADLLFKIQSQAVDMVPYEQFGLSNIRKLGPGMEQACQFQSLLVIQPKTEHRSSQKCILFSNNPLDKAVGLGNDIGQFETYGLVIICQLNDQGVDIELRYDATFVESALVDRLAKQFDQVLRQLCNLDQSSMLVSEIETISKRELQQVWAWNAIVPETVEACVHDLFTKRALQQPDALAIHAWDGKLTYRELDDMSTRLAYHLAEFGAGPGTIIPLCFEKSMWTSVAMLAVMKTGAASAAMDTTQPAVRLRAIVQQALSNSNSQRQLIISSVSNRELAGDLVDLMAEKVSIVVAAEKAVQHQEYSGNPPPLPPLPPLAQATPQDLLCVVFTSGSTGVPKGAMLTHANFSSAIKHQQEFPLITSYSRVFDFASYAFDASWHNLLCSVTLGATLCVPNEEERLTDLSGAISRFGASYILLPPSAARLISDFQFNGVETVVFGGEVLLASDANIWRKTTNAFNIYGPAECTVLSTAQRLDDTNIVDSPSIGRGCGTVAWVAQANGTRLAPIGEVGELWIEGPLVGQGYLGDAEKTAAKFIKDPPWLVRGGGPDTPGRRGRLYRTGDLVRYDATGALYFVGRKDDQVKIRGQRVELGEIEQHLRTYLAPYPGVGVVAEVIQPAKSEASKVLVAILALGTTNEDDIQQTVANMDAKLGDLLPSHMIPGAYISVDNIPMTATGKTDRMRLREIYSAMTLEQLAAINIARSRNGRTAPSTEKELQMQRLWAGVLGISPESIAAEDSFLRIGGDSIAAMRLAARARDEGLVLKVTDVFQHPRLCDLVTVLKPALDSYTPPSPFSVISAEAASSSLAPYLPSFRTQGATVVDLVPATFMQERFIRTALTAPGGSMFHFLLDFPSSVDPHQIFELCGLMWQQFDILRVLFIEDGENEDTFLQAIVQGLPLDLDLHETDNVDEFSRRWSDEDRQLSNLGQSFVRALICYSPGGKSRLVLRLSHAQYDGLSMELIVRFFDDGLHGRSTPSPVSFAGFMHQTQTQSSSSVSYWQKLLGGSSLTQVPDRYADFSNLCTVSQQPPHFLSKAIDQPEIHTTAAAVFAAVCALAISKFTGVRDVVFGLVVSGRFTLPDKLADVAGPCVNAIPLRVDTGAYGTFQDMTAFIQDQMISSSNFELCQPSSVKATMDWSPSLELGFEVLFQGGINVSPGFDISGERVELSSFTWAMQGLELKKPLVYIVVTPTETTWEVAVTGWLCDKEVPALLMDRISEAISAQR